MERCLGSPGLLVARASQTVLSASQSFPPSAQANQRLRNVGESGGNRAELWPQSAKIGRSFSSLEAGA
jgi:hypothetical protein